jgi:hypothetical protein
LRQSLFVINIPIICRVSTIRVVMQDFATIRFTTLFTANLRYSTYSALAPFQLSDFEAHSETSFFAPFSWSRELFNTFPENRFKT